MKKSPAFQFYPEDWLTDRDVIFMTPAQEGAYLRLICYCWIDNDNSIPDDDDQLSALCRIDKGALRVVKAKFIQHPTKDGFLTHSRLQKEAEKQRVWREKSAKGGKASSKKRIENKRKNKGGSRVVQPKGNTLSLSLSLDSSQLSKDNICAFEEFWKEYPRKINKKKSETAYKAALKGINHEQLINHTRKFAEAHKIAGTEKQFIPHATTWLNGKRWEDDLSDITERNGIQGKGFKQRTSGSDALTASAIEKFYEG